MIILNIIIFSGYGITASAESDANTFSITEELFDGGKTVRLNNIQKLSNSLRSKTVWLKFGIGKNK